MASITIDRVCRSYGSVQAVHDISLTIGDGEFFTLLGPSGCGKTTLLRMVAGFAELEAGAIRFGERRIDTLPPHRRNTGMVFQNYAIFPNLSVRDNVAYGLRARKIAPALTAERVGRALDLVHLGEQAPRWPHQLSGGQLQRVAIARALVIEPEVLLLDEPLSNLDAQLRVEMRADIRSLQKSLGITAIYVTHDQEEALAISDRIAVMRAGRFEQVGAPDAIYRRPATPFVAEFMGTTNLLAGIVGVQGTRIAVGATAFMVPKLALADGSLVSFSLRPEALRPLNGEESVPPGWASLRAELVRLEFLGALIRIEARLAGGALLRSAVLDHPLAQLRVGDSLSFAYEPARLTVFESTL
ncbi:iron(III) transport system ATP-binding protein/putative spermidine/putrescine transport system ATP-binding protein [Rhizobiales bacterium GAS188]|nr:iron(III) transport system ATP-binding protein/putative spermidine/putrescine transport system ATP-binding protein [Rhizobiales bacterium GAS188]